MDQRVVCRDLCFRKGVEKVMGGGHGNGNYLKSSPCCGVHERLTGRNRVSQLFPLTRYQPGSTRKKTPGTEG